MLAMVDIHGNLDIHGYPLDIWISIGNLEMQLHSVENLNTVGFLSSISV